MSAFRKFVEMINPPDIGRAFPSDLFVQLDRGKIIEKLKLDERAAKNGQRNYPAIDAHGLDDVEQEIVAEVQQYATRSQNEAASNHKVYGQRLAELALLRQLASITVASERALGDLDNLVVNARGRLSVAADQVRESYRELMEFKKEHNLRRPAHEGVGALVAWATFALSGVVETALNTVMLKVNDDYGYLGGAFAALVVAAVNVGGSAFVGRSVFPYLYHRSVVKKSLAGIAATAWLALIVCWNLLAAQFRDAKAAGIVDPDKHALASFVQTPFQLEGIYSYGLLVAGILFSVVAAVTALKMKDPYPGYGDLYKRHFDRLHDYSDEIEKATAELTEIRDDATSDATEIKSALGVQFRERGQIVANREHHRLRFRDHQRHLEDTCNSALQHYRQKNLQSRTDGLCPTHFMTKYQFHVSELPHSAEEPTTEDEVRRAEASLTDSIVRIGAAYTTAIHSFKHLDAIKQEMRRE